MQLSTFSTNPFQVQLSFNKVIEDLEMAAADPDHDKALSARKLLAEVGKHPELKTGITESSQIEENAGLIAQLMADYFPEALTHNEIKAIGIPYFGTVFNHSKRFQNILNAAGTSFEINIRDFDEHQFYVLSCCIILNEFYGTNLDFGKPLFYDIPTATGIIKHYRILYNAEFLDIHPTESSVSLTQEDINLLMDSYYDLDLWKEKFPPGSWILKGFALMTLIDVTVENAVSILKEKLLGLRTVKFQQSIESIFQSIYRIPDLRVGFTLYNPEEKKFSRAIFVQEMASFILPEDKHEHAQVALCLSSYKQLMLDKKYFTIADGDQFLKDNPDSNLVKLFKNKDIQSFILAPVIKDGILLGVLEIVSCRPRELNSVNANKLDVVMPFLTDTIERLVAELHNQVQAVIQRNYTSIHPSVAWKFKAEAQQYIEAQQKGDTHLLQEIIFDDLHPLYGQTDIKGSSDVRNSSVQLDLENQLQSLLNLILRLKTLTGLSEFDAEISRIEDFLKLVAMPIQANTEQFINNYLETDLYPRLRKISEPAFRPLLNAYLIETNKHTGNFYTSRRRYESTISLINERLASILDNGQQEAQSIFPHYYERFKTDGVEHNLYFGPSISPNNEYKDDYLKTLRLWQLRILCEAEIAHHQLKPQLPYPLDVTTLILVYHSTISIRFRMDEKRFDVDGTYNARYEMVKKRIDKAHIKGTEERITQSGMVTVVYSNDEDEREYLGYVNQLQKEGTLSDEVEIFEIEELQGVSGLKALRVRVCH